VLIVDGQLLMGGFLSAYHIKLLRSHSQIAAAKRLKSRKKEMNRGFDFIETRSRQKEPMENELSSGSSGCTPTAFQAFCDS